MAALTAIVIGSTSGIGLAIVKALARQGANLLINGLEDDGGIEKAIATVDSMGNGAVTFHSADMRSPDENSNLVDYCANQYSRCRTPGR